VPTVNTNDLQRMRDSLFFEGDERNRRLSRFWTLLLLAAVIASAGVIGDSTATVIGAMIVAPLMTPILGIVLSIVLGDRANLVRSLLLVVLGAMAVILVGWLLGKFSPLPIDAATSSQVAARVNPRIIDLVAALATGAVGAFALVRADVSDTLPGVAIAISLVPPLCVVGLTLDAGKTSQAGGALLLFVTNVAAILFTGVVVMAIFKVHKTRNIGASPEQKQINRRNAVLVVIALVLVVAIPLTITTTRVVSERLTESDVANVADDWATGGNWRVLTIDVREGAYVVRASGALPSPDPAALRAALDAAGQSSVDIELQLVPEERVELPGR
jgi:uncharacterized hydrophobic protein (TIGR00271 family)